MTGGVSLYAYIPPVQNVILTGSVHGKLKTLDITKRTKDFSKMGCGDILSQLFNYDL
jgi:hypothetical protein